MFLEKMQIIKLVKNLKNSNNYAIDLQRENVGFLGINNSFLHLKILLNCVTAINYV